MADKVSASLVSYFAPPHSTDHCARSKTTPTPHGTPRTAQRFAPAGGLFRSAAAWVTPWLRAAAICWPSSAGGADEAAAIDSAKVAGRSDRASASVAPSA